MIDHNQDLPSTMRIAIAVLALAFVGVSIAQGLLSTIGHRIQDVKFVKVCQYSCACLWQVPVSVTPTATGALMGVVTAEGKGDLAIIATLTTTLAARTSAPASSGHATRGPARPANTGLQLLRNQLRRTHQVKCWMSKVFDNLPFMEWSKKIIGTISFRTTSLQVRCWAQSWQWDYTAYHWRIRNWYRELNIKNYSSNFRM